MSSQTEQYPGAATVRPCTSDGKPIDSNNPIPVTMSGTATAGTTAPTTGTVVDGVYNSPAPILTAGQAGQAQMDSRGNIKVTLIGVDGVTNIGANRVINADGATAAVNVMNLATNGFVFNGTTWDRQRDVNSANGSTGTGVTSVGTLVYNPTTSSYVREQGDSQGTWIVSRGGAAIASNQVSIAANTATQVVVAQPGRQKIILSPTSSVTYYIGSSNGVTTSNGLYVAAGGSITLDTTSAIWVISATAHTMSYLVLA